MKGAGLSAVAAGTVIRMTDYRVAAPRVGHAEQLFRAFRARLLSKLVLLAGRILFQGSAGRPAVTT